jgi:Tol biopolymer transport system component
LTTRSRTRRLTSKRRGGTFGASLILKIGGLAALAFCGSLASSAGAWAQGTTRVSVPQSGFEGNGFSSNAAISADGRFVAFHSAATNLVANDGNAAQDVFVRDRTSGTTTRVSVPQSGFEANGSCLSAAISADGRFVAFESDATNLVAGDGNARRDIFVRDRTSGTTTRVSVPQSGPEANGHSFGASISADGRFVAFQSAATNLVASDGNGTTDVFVRDRTSGTTTRVSVPQSGFEGNGFSGEPVISADGRFIAFQSAATNLVAGDGNATRDIFVRDLTSGTTTRVSVPQSGPEPNGLNERPAISSDGRFVTFISAATNLVAGDSNATRDVFVRDRTSGTTTRVSLPQSGAQGNGGSFNAAISGDGRFVAFISAATNLVAGDSNGGNDIFVRDRTSAATTRVSVPQSGPQANGASALHLAISADSRFVAFESAATNLVANDGNAAQDVFVRDRGAFGPKTRVTLTLAAKRIRTRGPLKVRVKNANRFPVEATLSGKTTGRVGKSKRRVNLRAKSFRVAAKTRKIVELRLPEVLRREGGLSLRLTLRVTGPAGKTRTVTTKVTPRLSDARPAER